MIDWEAIGFAHGSHGSKHGMHAVLQQSRAETSCGASLALAMDFYLVASIGSGWVRADHGRSGQLGRGKASGRALTSSYSTETRPVSAAMSITIAVAKLPVYLCMIR